MKKTLLPLAAFMVLAGCTQAPPPVADTRDADTKAIRAVEESVLKGWETRNADQIGAGYAPNAQLIIPNTPTIKGSDVAAGMKDMLKDPNMSLKFATAKVEIAKSGDIGYTQGTYVMTFSDPKTKKVLTEKGRYVTAYTKQADGSWKIQDDINAADAPAAEEKK